MDESGAPTQAVRPPTRPSATVVLWVLRGMVVAGAAIAIYGAFLDWGNFVAWLLGAEGGGGELTVQGTDSPYGWIVVVGAVIAAVLVPFGLRGIALAALPSMAGGLAIVLWGLFYKPDWLDGDFDDLLTIEELFAREEILVPLFGLGLIGAASLIALGILLGPRFKEWAV